MCHPETAGAAIRSRAFAPADMAAEDGEGPQITTHMPDTAHFEILRRPAAPRKVCARAAKSAGASGRLRMTHQISQRIDQPLVLTSISRFVLLPDPAHL